MSHLFFGLTSMHRDKQNPNFLAFSGKPRLRLDEMNRLIGNNVRISEQKISDLVLFEMKPC
jgi:hypothetical protein